MKRIICWITAIFCFFCSALAQEQNSTLSGTVQWQEGVSHDGKVFGTHQLYNGLLMKFLAVEGMIVQVTLTESEKHIIAGVYIRNNTKNAFDLLPQNLSLQAISPKNKNLIYEDYESVARAIEKNAKKDASMLLLAGVFASRSQSTSYSTSNGSAMSNVMVNDNRGNAAMGSYNGVYSGSTSTTTTTHDPGMMNMALTGAENIRADGLQQAAWVRQVALKANTLYPGQDIVGLVFFEKDKKATGFMVRFAVGSLVLEYPF